MTNTSKHQDGQSLLDEMDKTIAHKVAVCSAHMILPEGAIVLDAGCANGRATAHFALQNPHVHVIGVDYDGDYIRQAQHNYAHISNLEFIEADMTKLDLGERKLDAILNLSFLHEPYSYNGYRTKIIEEIIAAGLKNQKPHAVTINRDFMLPDNPEDMVYIALPDEGEKNGNDYTTLSMAEFFLRYADEAMRFNGGDPAGHIKGFYAEEHTRRLQNTPSIPNGWRVFSVQHHFAWEFIWRMHYRERFLNEADEKYAFWTHQQHRQEPQKLGARVTHSSEYINPWLMDNWYKPYAKLFDANMKRLPLPPSNFISVLHKIEPEESVSLREHKIVSAAPSYLTLNCFKNTQNGAVYDMVSRPGGDVVDVLPFYREGEELHILAKADYPRPLSNIKPRMMSPNLDGKFWSGHMVEPLAAANTQGDIKSAAHSVLTERVGLNIEPIKHEESGSLRYYPAPAELNEYVHAVQVEITDPPKGSISLSGGYSGFSNDGIVRSFNAQGLLRAAQVGMLPEARLETGIYALMRQQGVIPDDWLGQEIKLSKTTTDIIPANLKELLMDQKKYKVFEPRDTPSGWLDIHRSEFHEVAVQDGKERKIASRELEFIVPSRDVSTNSVMLICLIRDKLSDEVLLGVQKISPLKSQFASVQCHTQDSHSGLLTLPGFRLPSSIDHLQFVPEWISAKIDAPEETIKNLGDGYFPSLGVMPHRIYPYVVTQPGEALIEKCDFIPLRDLFEKLEEIEDLHLINAICRTTHALDMWKEYTHNLNM